MTACIGISSLNGATFCRACAPQRPSRKVLTAAAQTGFYIARTPVMMDGRVELLQYYRQQSICHNYHRYGNLGIRALEEKDILS